MKVNTDVLKAIIAAVQIGSAKFVHVKNYKNQQGEVSDYLINLGMSYDEARLNDTAKLLAVSFEGLKEQARRELAAKKDDNSSDQTRTAQSWGQLEAYTPLGHNVKIHEESYELFMTGFLVTKTVKIPVEYPVVNSRPLTIAKNSLKKELDLTTAKYRQFKFSSMDQTVISINGDKIEITY